MNAITFDKTAYSKDYREILDYLIENWEHEIVEFKAASGQYSTDKIGQYFSAISNEANLKEQQYGWLILGVDESKKKDIVGTSFKSGDKQLLEKFKYEISKDTTDGISFLDIIELSTANGIGKTCRVLMFKIPAAIAGMPTAWKNRYYARSGESLTFLSQSKIDQIRGQERKDWSGMVVEIADIDFLDKKAITLARENYKEKMGRNHISEEVDRQTDEQFLTQLKLMVSGKVTNAAMILLGREDCDNVFETAPKIMWRLYGSGGVDKDYEIFSIPFLTVTDKILNKIRNLRYRYLPNQKSLFPQETDQYDKWLLRELLNNSIAHANYQIGGRIYVNEFEDHITISNPGNFLPEKIETVLTPGYNPPFYRNQRLADGMVKFDMIDTATSGIRKVYRIQKEKFFPMPDYDLSSESQVGVTVYGKILNEKYTNILFENGDLSLKTVFLLDQVQKGKRISKEAAAHLKQHHLIEGRYPNLYLSAPLAVTAEDRAVYIKNKGFDNKYYKDMIVDYLKQFGKAKRADIRKLLFEKFPDSLTDSQKDRKILTLLTSLKNKGIIKTDSDNKRTANWVLDD